MPHADHPRSRRNDAEFNGDRRSARRQGRGRRLDPRSPTKRPVHARNVEAAGLASNASGARVVTATGAQACEAASSHALMVSSSWRSRPAEAAEVEIGPSVSPSTLSPTAPDRGSVASRPARSSADHAPSWLSRDEGETASRSAPHQRRTLAAQIRASCAAAQLRSSGRAARSARSRRASRHLRGAYRPRSARAFTTPMRGSAPLTIDTPGTRASELECATRAARAFGPEHRTGYERRSLAPVYGSTRLSMRLDRPGSMVRLRRGHDSGCRPGAHLDRLSPVGNAPSGAVAEQESCSVRSAWASTEPRGFDLLPARR